MGIAELDGIFIPHLLTYTITIKEENYILKEMEELAMKKGFPTGDGYMGVVGADISCLPANPITMST